MTRDTSSSSAGAQITAVPLGGRTRAIVMRGAIRGEIAEELRGELRAAIDEGVRELVLDLSEVESISSPTRDLVAAAGTTLARRGGVLLVWWEKDGSAEPGYVMAEVREQALASLMTDGASRGGG
jgi:hypothetical protein